MTFPFIIITIIDFKEDWENQVFKYTVYTYSFYCVVFDDVKNRFVSISLIIIMFLLFGR